MGECTVLKTVFYDWGGLNIWFFHLINNIHSNIIDKIMLLGTALASHTLFNFYAALLALFSLLQIYMMDSVSLTKEKILFWITPLILFIVAYLLDGAFLDILKPYLDFPRPPLALPQGSLVIVGKPELHHSFPSGHSSFAMLIVASVWPILSKHTKWLAILFLIWVGTSRISLGAHFPADVAGGFLTSFLIVISLRKLLGTIENRINFKS